MIEADEKEKQRDVVRSRLDEQLNALKDDASFLQLVGQEYFDEIKYWHHGTTAEYQEKIFEIARLVEKSVSLIITFFRSVLACLQIMFHCFKEKLFSEPQGEGET